MTEEERKAQELAKDVAAMDEEQLREPGTGAELQPEVAESSDERVGEAGPADLVEGIKEVLRKEDEEVVAEPVDDEAYDFSFINDLARQALEQKAAPIQPSVEAAPAPSPAPVQPLPQVTPIQVSTPVDLVTLEEMTVAFDSPQKMVDLLHKVYTQARKDAIVEAVQQSLMALPNAVRPVLAKETAFVEMVKNFYTDNPELDSYRDFVRYCAVQVENEHPDWSPQDVMKETAKVAKKRLPMLREAMSRETKQAKPSFVDQKGPSSKTSGKKLSRLEQDLAAMPDY